MTPSSGSRATIPAVPTPRHDEQPRPPRRTPSAVLRERRALARVVPRFQLAVRGFEVVLVKTRVIRDQVVIADLEEIERGGLVAGVVPPAAEDQLQRLAPDGERAPFEPGVLPEMT